MDRKKQLATTKGNGFVLAAVIAQLF